MAEEIIAKKEPLFGMKGAAPKPAVAKTSLRKKIILAIAIIVIIGVAVAAFFLLGGILGEEALEKSSVFVPFLFRRR